MTAALEFKSVSKIFSKKGKKTQALSDVSFTIGESEVFGFVGPNGAGKSTTIKIMLDIITEYHGEVKIHGISSRNAHARRGVAYVPESPAIYEQFTPMELLKTAMHMYDIRRSNTDEWCMQWLERLSVTHAAHSKMRLLSKGTVQRVALAHAMAVSPSLLILDEPLSGLDPVGRKDFVEILTDYKNQGGAIFFTSHVLHDVERIADRFGFINKGELLTVRSPRDIAKEHADRFIIRYQSNDNPFPNASSLRAGEFEIEAPQNELPHYISRLNEQESHLLAINPAVSLESVFFKILSSYKDPQH